MLFNGMYVMTSRSGDRCCAATVTWVAQEQRTCIRAGERHATDGMVGAQSRSYATDGMRGAPYGNN